MIGVRRPLLFLGFVFLFSSLPPSVMPTDDRLPRLRLEDVWASPAASKAD